MPDNDIKPKTRKAAIKRAPAAGATEAPAFTEAVSTPVATAEANNGTIITDILYLLQTTVQSAKENPSVNNINAVVKSLNALKLAASAPGTGKGRKSKTMIAKRVIAYIEKEILNIG